MIIVIGVVIMVATGSFSGTQPGGGPDTVEVSGDRDQWTAAVCAANSDLATSSNFLYPDATDIAYCATKPTETSTPQSVVIGEWPREADIDADLARLPSIRWFATAVVGDHTTVFILLDSPDRSLLDPLTPFGFTISAPA